MSIFKFVFIIILALLPSIFWLAVCHRQDRKKPEPPFLIFKIFIWGILVAFLAFVIEHFVLKTVSGFFQGWRNVYINIFRALVVVAPIEEFLKYDVVKRKIYRDPHFDEMLDGIIYCVTAALGFAALENVVVALTQGTQLIAYRFLTTTLMHALATGFIGYYLGLVTFKHKSKWLIVFGLCLAIIFHGGFNLLVNYPGSLSHIAMLVLLVVGFIFLFFKIKKCQRSSP